MTARLKLAPAPDPMRGLDRLREAALIGHEQITRAATEAVQWVWHGIVAAEHHCEIAGPSYSGKTSLAFLLAVARANPGAPVEVLGRIVEPAPEGTFVVIVEEENSARSSAERLLASCEMLGLDPKPTLDRIIVLARQGVWAHLPSEDSRQVTLWWYITELARRGSVALTLIDSRARVLAGGDSDREADQAANAEIVFGLVEDSRSPVIVISHTRKAGSDTLEDVSGSAQRAAAADVVLLVRADRDDGRITSSRVTFAKLRDLGLDHPEPVTFSLVRSEGRWSLSVGEQHRSDVRDTPAHERVFAHLERTGRQTKNQIREALGLNAKTLEAAMTTLFGEKRLRRIKTNVGGRQRDAFEVKGGRDPFTEQNARVGNQEEAEDVF